MHGTRTQIDYYLITSNTLRHIKEVRIIPGVVSDHDMVELQWVYIRLE